MVGWFDGRADDRRSTRIFGLCVIPARETVKEKILVFSQNLDSSQDRNSMKMSFGIITQEIPKKAQKNNFPIP